MPKTITINTSASKAYGKDIKDFGVNGPDGKLVESVPYSFKFEELQKGEEIPAKEAPDAEDVRKLVNNKRKANERGKQLAEALKNVGIEAPKIGVDMEFTWKQFVGMLMKTGKDLATAVRMANHDLNTDYSEDDY